MIRKIHPRFRYELIKINKYEEEEAATTTKKKRGT